MRPTLDLPPVLRRTIWTVLALTVGLSGLARPAAAQALYADLDRDGVRDVIQHNGAWNSVVQVWLSKTASTRGVHTTLPLIWVRVVDLDGDGRLDLVGADRTTRVHVWHYRAGRLRPAHSAPSGPRAAPGSSGSLATDPGTDEIAWAGADPPPCHAPPIASLSARPARSTLQPASLELPVCTAVALPSPRAPPLSD